MLRARIHDDELDLGVQKILETACTIATYAAMLNVLFLAALMLAIKLTQDETKKYKMPQPWAQTAMLCCVNAVPTQVIIVLVIAKPAVPPHRLAASADEQKNIDVPHVESARLLPLPCQRPLRHHAHALRRLHHCRRRRLHDAEAEGSP